MERPPALDLVDRIYAAALEPAGWQDFASALSRAYGGAPTGFALQVPGFPFSGVLYVVGFAEQYYDRFMAHVLRGLPWDAARARNFVGRFGLASEVVSDAELSETPFYRECMEPQGLAHGPMGHTIAVEAGRPVAGLVIFPPPGRSAFDAEDLAYADPLVPHLARAYRIHAERRQQRALGEAIDRFPTGLLLLDVRGHVMRMNRGAEQILEQDDGLSLDDGALRASDPAENTRLREALTAVTEGTAVAGGRDGSVLAVSRRSGRRGFPLVVAPLRAPRDATTQADAVAVVYVSDLELGVVRRREALRELYGLTEAESRLVELLCQGFSLEEAADARGVTMNTARSQLKQVFAKTSTSRQSELVRLVLAGVASIGGP